MVGMKYSDQQKKWTHTEWKLFYHILVYFNVFYWIGRPYLGCQYYNFLVVVVVMVVVIIVKILSYNIYNMFD